MKKVLFIAGNSGSGKSYITKKLMENYPEIYYKLEQYTTRPRRTESENEYYYVNVEHYNIIKDKLMANTEVNGNFYGTIPTFEEDKVAVVIVNALGLFNGISYINKHNDIEYRVLYLENDTPFELRDDARDTYQEAKAILNELDKLSDEIYTVLINNVEKPLALKEVNEEIERLFNDDKIDEISNGIIIRCPWKTCIHNTGRTELCNSKEISLIPADVDINGEETNLLDCHSYIFDKDFNKKL